PLPRSILYIDQSSVGLRGYADIFEAMRATLDAAAKPSIDVYAENLDSTHFKGERYDRVIEAFIRDKYLDIPVGAIVAIGSAALEFALTFRAKHRPNVPIVFGLVDSETAARTEFPPGVTGTTFHFSLANNAVAARALVPNLKRIALVGDPLQTQ